MASAFSPAVFAPHVFAQGVFGNGQQAQIPVEPPAPTPTGGGGVRRRSKYIERIKPPIYDELYEEKRIAKIRQEDAEIEEFIITLITKGIL